MRNPLTIGILVLFLGVATALPFFWVKRSGASLAAAEAAPAAPATPVAGAANAGYCTPELKQILRRVLQSCGLLQSGAVRGCQPADAAQVAALSGGDFNALFLPMAQRAGVVQFDLDRADLDAQDVALIDRTFADQRGASYFFVVSRSSPEGSVQHNRELSERRANAVRDYLASRGIGADRLNTVSYGEERPKHDNSREETRRLNRRAALTVRLQ